MKKKFFKRAAAFAVASLMAVGVITVLPEECLPQISAEETADGIEINSENFPDDIFRQYFNGYDTDKNGLLSDEEINQVELINVAYRGISTLKGIEYFTALKILDCSCNPLTSLNVNNNTALTYLNCYATQITSLDISNNLALTKLYCSGNQLTSLDISKNTALIDLSCWGNPLTSLDVSNNTALEILSCNDNQLTSLDISNNTLLRMLDCADNQLTLLDVSNNTALEFLDVCGNQLTSLDVSKSNSEVGLAFYQKVDGFGAEKANSYHIGEICGAYDLKNLPGNFDVTKTSNWQGATLDGNMLTEIDNTGIITYDYDCWVGHPFLNYTAEFTLTYNLVEHIYGDGVITIEPTEQTEGEKIYTCTKCGATKTEPIAKLEHVHNQGNELMSDATGHWYTCSGCDEKLDFAAHTEDDGAVTVEPTETTEGQKVYKCTVCGYTTRTDVVAKLEHVHNKGTELVSDGTGHWYTCSGCDEKLDFAVHTEDNGTVTLAPTVTAEGQRDYKCTVCGYITRTETIAKLENGNIDPPVSQQPQKPEENENENEINVDAKKGWGNVVKEINAADENTKINVDMGNSTTVPKNVLNAVKDKDVDVVLNLGDGITWTINGKDVTDPQSINLSVTKKKNSIPEDMISDPLNTIPLVLTHNGSFGCSATLSIDLEGNDKKIANLYYYNSKTKELEFVDSCEIVNGKASLVFTHASDWAIVISDISAEYEDVSSAAGIYEEADDSQAWLCMIVIIIAVVGFSSIIIVKRFAKNKR